MMPDKKKKTFKNQPTALAGASKLPKKKNKGFTEHQPKGYLPDVFKYVPDAYQVSDWIQDVLSRDGSPANVDGKAIKGKTKGSKRSSGSK
tara:strand:+ start:53 stop:322 length:270 start_codon:yes stop_codon:yes gene_type:complete